MKNKISAVVLTQNEEKNIRDCIKSLAFCDEIVIIDDNSIDKTVKLANEVGAKVFQRDMDMDYAVQSNYGLQKAKNEWVFFLDADERVSSKLALEIEDSLKIDGDKFSGFSFGRIDHIWGRWLKHGEVAVFRSLRLFKKGKGKWERRVHPRVRINGKVGKIKEPILHYPHQSLRKFIQSVDRWSSWHAIANKEEGKTSSLVKIIFWPILHFVRNFLFRRGFRDGTAGFVFAVVMSFHSYLSWSKQWIKEK